MNKPSALLINHLQTALMKVRAENTILLSRIAELEDEVERLNALARDAILSLTDEIGTGNDPVAFVCAAYVASRQEIRELTERELTK